MTIIHKRSQKCTREKFIQNSLLWRGPAAGQALEAQEAHKSALEKFFFLLSPSPLK
jgi:hypothetical protein